MLITTPILNKAVSLSKLADPLNSYDQQSNFRPLEIREALIQVNSEIGLINIPHMELQKNWATEKKQDRQIYLTGTHYVGKDGQSDYFSEQQIEGFYWLEKKTRRLSLTMEIDCKNATVVANKIEREFKTTIINQQLVFHIKISFNIAVSEMDENTTIPQLEKAIKEKVADQIRQTYIEGLEKM